LFDLGETLLNFGRVNTTGVFRQSARLTYDFLQSCSQPVGNFTCYCWRNLIDIRVRCLWADITGRDFDALSLLKKAGTKRGFELTDQQWRQLGWLWYEPLSKLAKIEPTLKETLAKLKEMGLKLGILSNTFISAGSLDRHLAQLGILDFFPFRLYSYQYDFRKPDTRIFQAAAEKMNEMLENILFVGDRIDKDIRPARKAGMQAVLKSAYTNQGSKSLQGVPTINLIAELPVLVDTINTGMESPVSV